MLNRQCYKIDLFSWPLNAKGYSYWDTHLLIPENGSNFDNIFFSFATSNIRTLYVIFFLGQTQKIHHK